MTFGYAMDKAKQRRLEGAVVRLSDGKPERDDFSVLIEAIRDMRESGHEVMERAWPRVDVGMSGPLGLKTLIDGIEKIVASTPVLTM